MAYHPPRTATALARCRGAAAPGAHQAPKHRALTSCGGAELVAERVGERVGAAERVALGLAEGLRLAACEKEGVKVLTR